MNWSRTEIRGPCRSYSLNLPQNYTRTNINSINLHWPHSFPIYHDPHSYAWQLPESQWTQPSYRVWSLSMLCSYRIFPDSSNFRVTSARSGALKLSSESHTPVEHLLYLLSSIDAACICSARYRSSLTRRTSFGDAQRCLSMYASCRKDST